MRRMLAKMLFTYLMSGGRERLRSEYVRRALAYLAVLAVLLITFAFLLVALLIKLINATL
jgi:hypothetical protein